MPAWNRSVLAVGGAALAAAAGVSTSPPAGATTSCADSTDISRFAGAESPVGPIIGASAGIEYQYPYLCTETPGSTSGVSVWAMIYGGFGDTDGYAQAGYLRSPGGYQHFFSQYNRCYPACGGGGTVISPSSPTQPHNYKVLYDSNVHRIRMYWNANLLDTTSWDPYAVWSGANQAQYFGETHDRGDDVPGTSANVLQFTNASVQDAFTGTNVAPAALNHNVTPGTRYYSWVWSNMALDIWTG